MSNFYENLVLMDVPHLLGWLAAGLVLTSFYLRTIVPLRLVAAISNVAFIFYAVYVSAPPILVLHALLLPLNFCRLVQHYRMKNKIEGSLVGNVGQMLLLPHMRRRWLPAGSVLFNKNEPSDKLIYIVEGTIELVDGAEIRSSDELLGVIGVFTQDRKRLDTAVAKTKVQVGLISVEKVKELMLHEPVLSRFMLQCLAERVSKKPVSLPVSEFPHYPLSLSKAMN